MANQKLTQLTEATSVSNTDITYAVLDPTGTPTSNKVTMNTFLSNRAITDPTFLGTSLFDAQGGAELVQANTATFYIKNNTGGDDDARLDVGVHRVQHVENSGLTWLQFSTGTSNFTRFNTKGLYVSGSAGPIQQSSWFEWQTGLVNLVNGVDNYIPGTTDDSTWSQPAPNLITQGVNQKQVLAGTSTVTSVNPALSAAYIQARAGGWYRARTRVFLFDMFNNVDVEVWLYESATPSAVGLKKALLIKEKFAELTASRLMEGSSDPFFVVSADKYYYLSIIPSANTPFPSVDTGAAITLELEHIG